MMAAIEENGVEGDEANRRSLGDEWEDWDGHGDEAIREGRILFLGSASAVVIALDFLLCLFAYLISPRLSAWHDYLPIAWWSITFIFILFTIIWFIQLLLTIILGRNFLMFGNPVQPLFDVIFSGVFHLAKVIGISKDRMGHSFVRAYNDMSRAIKPKGRREKLLLLLPRCLTKEQLKEINALKEIYPIHVHVVSGGELARKRIKEIRPSAVIGVACERDLISGIRDVGKKISLIGIPNTRPDGPCKNTHIDMSELIDAIEFYVGPPGNPKEAKQAS